jgi:hypothetical protein
VPNADLAQPVEHVSDNGLRHNVSPIKRGCRGKAPGGHRDAQTPERALQLRIEGVALIRDTENRPAPKQGRASAVLARQSTLYAQYRLIAPGLGSSAARIVGSKPRQPGQAPEFVRLLDGVGVIEPAGFDW